MKQILYLFKAYCTLTYFECKKIGNDGELLATQKQLETFMNKINLENALPPSESAFLKMLIGESIKTGLVIVETNVDNTQGAEDDILLNPLNPYFNTVLEKLYEGRNGKHTKVETSEMTLDTIAPIDREEAIAILLQMYRLKGRSSKHQKNVFFTVTDVKYAHSQKKAYKNIDDIPKMLNKLYKLGFVDKLEYRDSKGQNIYYLTSKCKNITEAITVTETDVKKARNLFNAEMS